MAKYKLMVDVSKCIGCNSCVVACKQEFNFPAGPMPIRVIKIGPKKLRGELRTHYVPVFCKHCENAACIKACPEEAMHKRADGLVIVDQSKCTGCQMCIDVCPINAPQYNPVTKKVELRNLCAQRIDKGEKPLCVLVCPARCMYFGESGEVNLMTQDKKVKDALDL